MLKECIEYSDGLAIRVFSSSINEYPIHMHDELEIIYVIEGEINLKDTFHSYTLEQGDVYFINGGDLHSIYKKSDSNLILFLQIDLENYKKYHPYVDKIIYICDSYYNKAHREEIERIKQYLIKIMLEVLNKEEGYRKKVEALVISCLLNLINDFQYYSMDDKKLKNENKYKGDHFQIQRIHRITDYIYSNYNKKISLEQISKEEHISKYYLTRLLKYGVGYGFQDTVNLVRVELSEKLLLGTEMTIEDIVHECGFSSYRYYTKHFKKFFGITPSEHRKKFKDKTIRVKKIKYLDYDKEKAVKKIKNLLKIPKEKQNVYSFEGVFNIIEIDFTNKGTKKFEHYWNYLNLPNIYQGLTLEYQKYLEKFQEDIGFKYIRLNPLDCIERNYTPENFDCFNQLFNTCNRIRITPIITMNYEKIVTNGLVNELPYILNNFILYCMNKYGYESVKNWKFELHSNVKDNKYNYLISEINKIIKSYKMTTPKEKNVMNYSLNSLYDTEFMASFIVHNLVKSNKDKFKDNIMLIDSFHDYSRNHSFFHGGLGLITLNGLRKSSYYGFYLLSKLGDEIIAKGDGYVATKNNDSIQILIYNYDELCNNLFIDEKIELKVAKKQLHDILNTKKEFILRLMNIGNKYIIKRYKLDIENGFVYKHWENMGCPQSISKENEELIQRTSFPKITFSHIEQKSYYDLHITLEPFNVELITFEKMSYK
ncbi:helix-turn-helix domain-containing protein [Natronincola ferrireducens]|uniref:AraC-type DNA-binding protein n=1 Tax=Natronincola ferrireducens TaxID=393762 RepID=A0A1G8Z0G4_9FIRM|nr:helix-turn-helix domain-containing protein [Natronincola ferrireducens]SDK08521.1 AraC-type DNA-binding protein [Natronincola ferrireducens]